MQGPLIRTKCVASETSCESSTMLLARIECILEHGLVVVAGIRLKYGSSCSFYLPNTFF